MYIPLGPVTKVVSFQKMSVSHRTKQWLLTIVPIVTKASHHRTTMYWREGKIGNECVLLSRSWAISLHCIPISCTEGFEDSQTEIPLDPRISEYSTYWSPFTLSFPDQVNWPSAVTARGWSLTRGGGIFKGYGELGSVNYWHYPASTWESVLIGQMHSPQKSRTRM